MSDQDFRGDPHKDDAVAPPARRDPRQYEAQAAAGRLGGGRPLEQSVRSRMESVFGSRFGDVRIHTDAQAASMAGGLGARAFTVGEHVAFGSGEYRPGTAVGDAIIAHELAHVVQQRAGRSSTAPKSAGTSSEHHLERDADTAAADAVSELWMGAQGGSTDITKQASPKERSGPRLARCNGVTPSGPGPKKSVTVNPTHMHGSSGDLSGSLDFANTKVYSQANVEVKKGTEMTVDETKSKAILGDDLILEEYKTVTSPTEEEKALFKLNQSASRVTMYFVKGQSDGNTGEAFLPSSGVGFVGYVVSNAGNTATFSHELGHVLLDSASHTVPDDTYLMYASKKEGKYKLTPEQITKIRASPYVT